MNRREFIKNSILAASGAVLLSGCTFKTSAPAVTGGVATAKFKDISVSMLGFGAMRLPTDANGNIDDALNKKMVKTALDAGINYFDTAYMYMNGKSERAMGDALKPYDRDSFNLTTKMPVMMLDREEDVERIFNEQLERCRTDHFDFYLVHCLNKHNWENTKKYNVIPFLEQKKKEGKIKYLGFSHHDTPELLQEIIDYYDKWEFVQLQINKIDWKSCRGEEQYNIARIAKLPIIVMEPLRGGVLCDLPQKAKELLKKECPNDTQASFGLRWVASKPLVFTILSGMSNFQQLKENVDTFVNYKKMTEKELEIAKKIAGIIQSQGAIACTACKYCMEVCPRGINIPAIFGLYNVYKGSKQKNRNFMFVYNYNALDESTKADKCIDCNLCSKNCPQNLEIPKLLKKVIKEYEIAQKEV